MAAAAWADGVIQQEEIALIRDFLRNIPGVEDSAWKEMEMYLSLPVKDDERLMLIEDLVLQIQTQEDRKYALESIRGVFDADGEFTEDEFQTIALIQRVIIGGREALQQEYSKIRQSNGGSSPGPRLYNRVI